MESAIKFNTKSNDYHVKIMAFTSIGLENKLDLEHTLLDFRHNQMTYFVTLPGDVQLWLLADQNFL